MVLNMMVALSEPVSSTVTEGWPWRLPARAIMRVKESWGIRGWTALRPLQDNRHIWFVPNDLLKFRICYQPSSTRRLHTKIPGAFEKSKTCQPNVTMK